jgi:hypothetical protein
MEVGVSDSGFLLHELPILGLIEAPFFGLIEIIVGLLRLQLQVCNLRLVSCRVLQPLHSLHTVTISVVIIIGAIVATLGLLHALLVERKVTLPRTLLGR